MASINRSNLTPENTPDVPTIAASDSPFNSRSLTVSVGTKRKVFTVHEAILGTTSFFTEHGLPATDEVRLERSLNQVIHQEAENEASGGIEVKSEDFSDPRNGRVVDFHIEDHFCLTPDAFTIFINHLYHIPPKMPVSRNTVRTLLRAYGIALRYRCYSLQNKILDCLRQFHSRHPSKLDDLIWAANRFGDDTKCPLNAYLVEQIAYEIASNGLAEFTEQNGYSVVTFIQEGDRAIRGSLFGALARHAQKAEKTDPAIGRNKFHVHEKGAQAGQSKT